MEEDIDNDDYDNEYDNEYDYNDYNDYDDEDEYEDEDEDEEVGNSDLIYPSALKTKKNLSIFNKSGSLSHLKFLSHLKRNHIAPRVTSGACTYGVIDTHGHFTAQQAACHSSLSNRHILNRLGYYNLVYTRDPSIKIPRSFLDYIYDKKLSPWRSVLARGFAVKHYDDYSAVATTNFDVSSQLLCSFLKSTRIYTETNDHIDVLVYLLSRNVHPGVALFLAQCYRTSKNDNYLVFDPDWHGSFINYNVCPQTIINFINGSPRDNQVPYHKRISYSGVDSIWGVDYRTIHYDMFLKEQYPTIYPEPETIVSRFGGEVKVSGLTLDDLYLIAIQESARCLVS